MSLSTDIVSSLLCRALRKINSRAILLIGSDSLKLQESAAAITVAYSSQNRIIVGLENNARSMVARAELAHLVDVRDLVPGTLLDKRLEVVITPLDSGQSSLCLAHMDECLPRNLGIVIMLAESYSDVSSTLDKNHYPLVVVDYTATEINIINKDGSVTSL